MEEKVISISKVPPNSTNLSDGLKSMLLLLPVVQWTSHWIFMFYLTSLICEPCSSLSAWNHDHREQQLADRRSVVQSIVTATAILSSTASMSNANDIDTLSIVKDPETYSALAYAAPNKGKKNPLILVLHGAGRNDQDILTDFANPRGEHAGLIPSLIVSKQAPKELLENFSVLAPYAYGKASFYQDSRSQLLHFVDWAIQNQGTEACPITFDPNRIMLFGFSDGATVAVELLTTRRFLGGVICSYGYSGPALPQTALDRLANLPIWVFHSADDVIFDVKNSDRLVQQLRSVLIEGGEATDSSALVKYSRYDQDPEKLPQRVRGHSMGITASKSPQVYDWMMQVPPIA
jgi:predicted peptidase